MKYADSLHSHLFASTSGSASDEKLSGRTRVSLVAAGIDAPGAVGAR